MPLSLNDPEGFSPSYCRNRPPGFMPRCSAMAAFCWRIVWPSPMVTLCVSGQKSSSSRNRQTPEKSSRFSRVAQRLPNVLSVSGTGIASQLYWISEQVPAARALEERLAAIELGPACGIDASLKSRVNWSRTHNRSLKSPSVPGLSWERPDYIDPRPVPTAPSCEHRFIGQNARSLESGGGHPVVVAEAQICLDRHDLSVMRYVTMPARNTAPRIARPTGLFCHAYLTQL